MTEPVFVESVDAFKDNRGEIWTSFEASSYGHSVNHVKVNTNRRGVFRGFHSDAKTTKVCTCLKGNIAAIIVWPDNSRFKIYELSSAKHSTLMVPPTYYNGFVSPEESIYMYQLMYEGEYADAADQRTLLLENSCVDVSIVEDLLNGAPIIRSIRDMP